MKKISILIATAITLSACSGNKDSNGQDNAPAPPEPMQTSAPAPATSSSDIVISHKDTGKTANVLFLVKNIVEPPLDRSKSFGHENANNPEDNEKYIAVQVWVKNVSNKEETISQDEFKIVDQSDAEFAEHSGFTEHRKKPILFNEAANGVTLKPNQSASGWITFTTDIKAKAKKIVYSNVTVNL
ncbi:hypothetical protein CJD36_011110 [Flavipsychrobacter stenotrophus]|uniref:DUF4352 domain-containing protein n=1 Tax=Flavipsychrobacter stenotrophus TaxID=2077091 RepID=A0A2S7SV60_9BACT|nr:DUF4352 domain-containing protein [Flavipsychrobacter stenotrophus]PQJ10517.1 hypothetical protein CJD36_011110 [Flavipsychrobacter stenotrophus]